MPDFKTIFVDKSTLIKRMTAAIGAVKYKCDPKNAMLGKPKLGAMPGQDFKQSDCSGFVRWILHAATEGAIALPLGSYGQWEWCRDGGFKLTDYKHAGCMDHRLRIAFIKSEGGKLGHVWLILDGWTLESHGGKGANRRKWNTDVLINNVDACYVLTGPLE